MQKFKISTLVARNSLSQPLQARIHNLNLLCGQEFRISTFCVGKNSKSQPFSVGKNLERPGCVYFTGNKFGVVGRNLFGQNFLCEEIRLIWLYIHPWITPQTPSVCHNPDIVSTLLIFKKERTWLKFIY